MSDIKQIKLRAPLPASSFTAEQAVKHIVDWIKKTNDIPRPDNPPSWVHDEGTWEKAKAAVQPYWGNYSEPWAVVAHVYYNMGGS